MIPQNIFENELNNRIEKNAFRSLTNTDFLIDFCSNDYLGFAQSEKLKNNILGRLQNGTFSNGATGSRLLTGNSSLVESVEEEIKTFHKAESALIFNSGYTANLGFFSCIAKKNDTILSDSLCHASIRDGIRLSFAKHVKFIHNDLKDLERKLVKSTGNRFVVVESVYSMDGDFAPLKEIVDLCKYYNANVIVDEAHATGVIGKTGEGMINHLGLENDVFARVHTFGKALGTHGAVILGSEKLKTYLINYSRPFIYTTALPDHSLVAISESYKLLTKSVADIEKLRENVTIFYENLGLKCSALKSPVFSFLVPGNSEVKNVSERLKSLNINVLPVLSPTVQEGKERLRICLHSFNSKEEIGLLTNLLGKL